VGGSSRPRPRHPIEVWLPRSAEAVSHPGAAVEGPIIFMPRSVKRTMMEEEARGLEAGSAGRVLPDL
jgi:hypothetical protein